MSSQRTLWLVVAWCALFSAGIDRARGNFITYVDDSGENLPDDYVIDEQHRPKKERLEDYNEALDRLISKALNQTDPTQPSGGNRASGRSLGAAAPMVASSAEQSIACIGSRKPMDVKRASKLLVRKCCPKGQSFHRLSITTCHPMDPFGTQGTHFSLLARQLDYYGPGCHEYGKYLRYNITIDKKCVGQRLIFNDRGTQMLLIQNGSLVITRGDRIEFYDDFCVEESGNMVLAAHICDPESEPDLFSGWLGTSMIVLASIASAVTVLAYMFDRTLPHRYGPLIGSHAGLLVAAILVELFIVTFEQGEYRVFVEVLVEMSYSIFVLFCSTLFFSSATGTTSINYRLLLVVVFLISSCSLVAMALTIYFESVMFLAVLASLSVALIVSGANVYTSFGRNHLGFNSNENPFEMINEGSTAKRIGQRRELTIVSTFACATQIIVWIPYSMDKYSLLSVLAWNAIIVCVVFVGLRRRSIGLCNLGKRLKHQRSGPANGNPYAEQVVPRDTQTVITQYPDEDGTTTPYADGENELRVV